MVLPIMFSNGSNGRPQIPSAPAGAAPQLRARSRIEPAEHRLEDSRLRCGLRLSELLGLTVDRVRRLPVLLVITFRHPKQALVNHHGFEALPDHCFGTAHHLIDNAGGAHQSLGLTDRFTGQQAHLFEVTCELWSWWKSAKSLHGKLLSIKMGLTNHRKLRIRNDLVWRRIVTSFPFPHDAVAQPGGRSVRKLRTKDEMACSILD